MFSDKINKILPTMVNAGVLLSVVLLIFEIRQNQDIAIAQIRNDISRQAVERDIYVSSPEIASIMVKAGNGEDLSEVESYQIERALSVVFQTFENIVYQYEAGMYTDDEFRTVEKKIKSMPSGMLDYYTEQASDYSTSFQRTMTRILKN